MKRLALLRSRERDAFAERNEHVLVARHQNFEAAGRLQLLGKGLAEREHDVLLDGAVLLGAGVVTAMARVDDDDRLEGALRQHCG